MLKSNFKVIAITCGDPTGIGPEVTARALSQIKTSQRVEFVVIGDERIFSRYWPKDLDFPLFIHMESEKGLKHRPGISTSEAGRDALLYLNKAIELIKGGRVHGLVTAPLAKDAVAKFSKGFKGHTTYLAEAFSQKQVEMLFVAGAMRAVLVTRHIPLMDVPSAITQKKIKDVTTVTANFIKKNFKITKPKVAVLGLNPHAGENGHMGQEEKLFISPAIKKMKNEGLNVFGPFPADTFFDKRVSQAYDLVVAMYHDQALVALKANYFEELVNVTVGLPFVRTSPAHGTAFGIAGKKKAHPGSMKASIELAIKLVG